MTVALVEDEVVTIGHVGDSRAYLVRDGRLEQLTEDHSLVNELLKSGKLSPQEAETHPQRSVITRAVGTDPDVDVDAFTVAAQVGDVFLLCSDGLTDMVGDEDILDLVERYHDDLDRVAKSLVSAANRGGGEDNITVIAFTITAGDDTVRMPAAEPDEDTLEGIPVADLPKERAQLIGEFEFIRQEVEDIRHFDKLMDSGISQRVREINPSIVYCQFGGDVNRDHHLLFQALLVATRPTEESIEAVYAFDMASSTEWRSQ